MLYELRRYDVAPIKLPALLDRFGSFTVQKWKEYGFRLGRVLDADLRREE